MNIKPNTECPVCGKRHREGSRPLAACQAEADRIEAAALATIEAEANQIDTAQDMQAAEHLGWHVVASIVSGASMYTSDANSLLSVIAYGNGRYSAYNGITFLGSHGSLSEAIEAAEATKDMTFEWDAQGKEHRATYLGAYVGHGETPAEAVQAARENAAEVDSAYPNAVAINAQVDLQQVVIASIRGVEDAHDQHLLSDETYRRAIADLARKFASADAAIETIKTIGVYR